MIVCLRWGDPCPSTIEFIKFVNVKSSAPGEHLGMESKLGVLIVVG